MIIAVLSLIYASGRFSDLVLFDLVLFDVVLFDLVLFGLGLFDLVLFGLGLFDLVLFGLGLFDLGLNQTEIIPARPHSHTPAHICIGL